MGFLSAYSGTRRLDVGGDYWIEYKECLSVVEKQRAEKALAGNTRVDMNGHAEASLDTAAFANEMVTASITAWNLDDDNGTVWPLAPDSVKRANIARLPASVFDEVFAAVNGANGPREKSEQVRFPEPRVSGDSNGHAGPVELGDLRA